MKVENQGWEEKKDKKKGKEGTGRRSMVEGECKDEK